MDFSQRTPSAAWEPVSLPELPKAIVWVWFRPVAAPNGLIFQLPAATVRACGSQLSLRRLLAAVGIDARLIHLCGVPVALFDAAWGMNPLLDQPLVSGAGMDDVMLIAHLHQALPVAPPPAPPLAPITPLTAPPGRGAPRGSESVYAAIDSDWNAIRLIEAQLAGTRKQLNSLFGRLQSLNRDLSTEERLAGDNQDSRDWQDVRRWLRDCAAQASRVLRAYDIGVTSAAGNRNRFDDIYDQYIAPRRSVDGLPAIQQQFESHRKTVQSLQTEMQSVLTTAARDGEQRAQQLLSRIHAKMRKKKTH